MAFCVVPTFLFATLLGGQVPLTRALVTVPETTTVQPVQPAAQPSQPPQPSQPSQPSQPPQSSPLAQPASSPTSGQADASKALPTDAAPLGPTPSPASPPASVINQAAPAEPSLPQSPGKPAPAGPVIELAPEESEAAPPSTDAPPRALATTGKGVISWGLKAPPNDPLLFGLAPERRRATSTVIGGYGQFVYSAVRTGPASKNDFVSRANLRRLVLFVAQDLGDKVELYTELEWENAIACPNCQGAVEIEQAVLDWKLYKDHFVLRTGLILVPMGIINQWHEPPIFHGVDRPAFDQAIIPSTWRELGIGATGNFAKILRYELYAMTSLNPGALGPDGIIGGRTHGSLARADAPAITGRLEAEPILGAVVGASGYFSDLGTNEDFYNVLGRKRKLHVPVIGYDVDARIKRWGLEARAIWSQFFLPESVALMRAHKVDDSLWYPNVDKTGAVPLRTQGGYAEIGYNVLRPIRQTEQELVPFVRAEYYDTQAKVPRSYQRRRDLSVQELTMGLSYRPFKTLVFKFDVQLRDRLRGNDSLLINAGTGFMM